MESYRNRLADRNCTKLVALKGILWLSVCPKDIEQREGKKNPLLINYSNYLPVFQNPRQVFVFRTIYEPDISKKECHQRVKNKKIIRMSECREQCMCCLRKRKPNHNVWPLSQFSQETIPLVEVHACDLHDSIAR